MQDSFVFLPLTTFCKPKDLATSERPVKEGLDLHKGVDNAIFEKPTLLSLKIPIFLALK